MRGYLLRFLDIILQFLKPPKEWCQCWMDLFRYPVIFVTVQRLTSVPLDLLVVQIERRGDSTLESPSSSATRLLIIDNRRLEEILKKWEALRKGSTFEINHHYWWISLVYRLLHSGILCEFWQRDLFFHWKDLKGPLFDISVYLFDHHFVETSLSNWNSVILAAFLLKRLRRGRISCAQSHGAWRGGTHRGASGNVGWSPLGSDGVGWHCLWRNLAYSPGN